MELVEKKCPNCGADLKFGHNDSEVKCNYCNTSFMIKKDNNTNMDSGSVVNPESFELQKKVAKTIGTTFIIVFLLIFIFSICIFIFVFSKIFSHFNGLL